MSDRRIMNTQEVLNLLVAASNHNFEELTREQLEAIFWHAYSLDDHEFMRQVLQLVYACGVHHSINANIRLIEARQDLVVKTIVRLRSGGINEFCNDVHYAS
jgi:hypothetical protein